MRTPGWVTVVIGLAMTGTAAAQPAPIPSDPELEARMRADVEAASPAAATAFDEGNAARESGRLDDAIAAYRRAIELAPRVDHPHRRLCGVLEVMERPDEAHAECEIAYGLAPDSPYNQMGMSSVLSERHGPGDLERGLQLARAAVDQLPADPSALGIWCAALGANQRFAELPTCIQRLLAADPDGLGANYLAAIMHANNGNFASARVHLAKAGTAGLPADEQERLLAAFADAEAGRESSSTGLPMPSHTFLWLALWIFVGWLGVMVALLVTGYILSRRTLAVVSSVTGGDAVAATGTEREQRLRKVYRVVLGLCGGYFYLSIPILIATIVIAAGGAVYLMFAIGYIPVKLVVILGIVVFATLAAILRSVVVRVRHGELGHRIDLAKEPKLRAMIEEVAAAVGTRPADAAYLTPGTDMAVTERAGIWASVRGKRTERSLIMGVGLFDGMTQLQLRSVLAHEHGHYRNADTAGGGFALAVRRSVLSMIIRLAQSGAASNLNPVWWFLRGYHRIYLVVSQGASRLQEVLADRWAVQAYGTAGFVDGYRHVIARSVAFDRQSQAALRDVLERGRALPNLYQYVPSKAAEASAPSEADIAHAIEEAMNEPPTVYDSHPAPRQRIAWAEALAVSREPVAGDDDDIWSLFSGGRDELERTMTARVRDGILENHNFKIPEDPKDADPEEDEVKTA
jgi:Zn-dependent protease with chaperone function/Flp pilus assembly protein TadD